MTRDLPPAAARGWRAVVRVLRSPLPGHRSPLLALQTPLDDISSVLFPSPCRVCGDPLLRSGFSPVCDGCIARVIPHAYLIAGIPARTQLCARCGEHLGYESGYVSGSGRPTDQPLCAMCSVAPPPFVSAIAYSVYQDELRAMLHLLKYGRVRAVAAPLGKMLAQAIAEATERMSPEARQQVAVVAVPLFSARERERGFNQTVLMCDVALRILRRSSKSSGAHPLGIQSPGAPSFAASSRRVGCSAPPANDLRLTAHHNLLIRKRATESQFRLSAAQRRENLRGAFATPRREAVSGKNILLVDDIFTTGATARECAETLLRAGAASVHVATLARAQTEVSTSWDDASFAATVLASNRDQPDRTSQTHLPLH